MMAAMAHAHHAFFVVLSLLVAVFGSWTALDLFRRVRSHIGRARRVWLGTAAVAMGSSIWSMHFIAMLGFDPGGPVSYDLPLTFLSLVLAIGATCGAFFAAAGEGVPRMRTLAAGAAMGAGICLMHYVGMAALRTAVSLGYRPSFVIASFVIAVAAATAALFAARRERAFRWRAAAALALGFAIVGMHYTAMAGLKLTIVDEGSPPLPGAPPFILGISVAGGTLTILFLALLASLYDQRLNVLSALEAGQVGYWELTVPEYALQVSARGKEIMGADPQGPFVHADLIARLTPEAQGQRERLVTEALESGAEYDAEYQLTGEGIEGRWINIRGKVVNWRHGRPRRLAGVILDVTDRRKTLRDLADAERRQRLLIDELNHRVKNTLATVQSIARQTAKGAASIEAFRDAFEARLLALSHTHNALTRGAWEQASLRELLAQEFSPYRPEQVRIEGADVSLKPREALALGMVFHELATNAAKYGALALHSGCVEVRWSVDEARRLHLTWSERGGPAVRPPTRLGFGSRLVQTALHAELGGETELEYRPDGLQARLTAPLG
jgi:NO-binding membrane sensor protein with MHYT domain/two-component sensor histidine kinase